MLSRFRVVLLTFGPVIFIFQTQANKVAVQRVFTFLKLTRRTKAGWLPFVPINSRLKSRLFFSALTCAFSSPIISPFLSLRRPSVDSEGRVASSPPGALPLTAAGRCRDASAHCSVAHPFVLAGRLCFGDLGGLCTYIRGGHGQLAPSSNFNLHYQHLVRFLAASYSAHSTSSFYNTDILHRILPSKLSTLTLASVRC